MGRGSDDLFFLRSPKNSRKICAKTFLFGLQLVLLDLFDCPSSLSEKYDKPSDIEPYMQSHKAMMFVEGNLVVGDLPFFTFL